MKVVPVPGDGDCQFSAFIVATKNSLFRTSSDIRRAVISHLRETDDWVPFLEQTGSVENTKENYLRTMSLQNVWGDNITLQAMSELTNACVVVRHLNGCIQTITPSKKTHTVTVFLKYDAERMHYSALV